MNGALEKRVEEHLRAFGYEQMVFTLRDDGGRETEYRRKARGTEEQPFVEALALATELYTDAELAVWLTSPQPLLEGWTPLQLLGCGKAADLLRVMQALDAGVYL